ncbi:MAG: hypothetical protein ACTSUB_00140 [Candidatus Thorarchaeota archaeon]
MNTKKRLSCIILAVLLFCPVMDAPVAAQDAAVMDFVMAYPSDVGEQNLLFARSARST